ncbi:MAG TPA: DedA family protein [Kofleriaceae bacterium]|nr:DedA family protein [Kofleriaceae bacterium]
MDFLHQVADIFLHLDHHLQAVIGDYGGWTYAILAIIILCETGLVVTPFLPGDSLLFAAGTLAALDPPPLSVWVLVPLLSAAAIAGDTLNYTIGKRLGPRVFRNENARFFKRAYLVRTQAFFERYGGKTIVLARFVPIVRTFAPFVAGIGKMTLGRFLAYNVTGGVLWVSICVFAGFLFGNIPVVRENFSIAVLAVIFISLVPAIVEGTRHWLKQRSARAERGEA